MNKKSWILLVGLLILAIFFQGCGRSISYYEGSTNSSSSSRPNPFPGGYVILNFIDNSGLPANSIHVAVCGQDWLGQHGYYDLTKEPATFIVTNTWSAVPDITLTQLISSGNKTIAYLNSGRIYFSKGSQLHTADNGADPGDFNTPNSTTGIIYDKIELAVVETGCVANLTQVDFFGIPMVISCNGQVRGFVSGVSRATIFNDFDTAMVGDWKKLILTDSGGANKLRILNPEKIPPGSAQFGSLPAYWDALINEYWTPGMRVTINTDETIQRTIIGIANGSIINFGADGKYTKPTSIQLFGQELLDGDAVLITKWVSAAMNRGVIKNPITSDQADKNKFYGNSLASNGGLYHKYAAFLHSPTYTIDGKAYALAYDDVFGEDSKIPIPNHATLTINILAF